MRHLRRPFAALAIGLTAAVVVVGCASHRRAPSPPIASAFGDTASSLDSLVLEIENHNWSDIVVFALHDGRSSRLAQVTAGRSLSVPLLPRHLGPMGTLRLSVHPIGGSSDYTSESLSLRTGNTIRLTVESRVVHSSVAVW